MNQSIVFLNETSETRPYSFRFESRFKNSDDSTYMDLCIYVAANGRDEAKQILLDAFICENVPWMGF